MKSFSVADKGWLSQALEAINAEKPEPVQITVSGAAAAAIMGRITEVTSRLPILKMFEALKPVLPVGGALPEMAENAIPVLASVGAMGGVAGTMAFASITACSKGWKPSFVFDLGSVLDPTDDKFRVDLAPPH